MILECLPGFLARFSYNLLVILKLVLRAWLDFGLRKKLKGSSNWFYHFRMTILEGNI